MAVAVGALQPGDTALVVQFTASSVGAAATGWVELAPAVAWDGGELVLPQVRVRAGIIGHARIIM